MNNRAYAYLPDEAPSRNTWTFELDGLSYAIAQTNHSSWSVLARGSYGRYRTAIPRGDIFVHSGGGAHTNIATTMNTGTFTHPQYGLCRVTKTDRDITVIYGHREHHVSQASLDDLAPLHSPFHSRWPGHDELMVFHEFRASLMQAFGGG